MANKYTRNKGTIAQKPDEFVTFWQRVYERVLPHARNLAAGVVGALVLLGVVYGVSKYLNSSKEGATEALGRAIRTWEADLVDDKAPKPEPKEGDVAHFKTAKERAEATLAELDKVDKEHGGSDAAKRAQLVRAGVLFELGRYDESDAAYRKFLDSGMAEGALRFVAREGVGLTLEVRGKLDEALKEYQELEKGLGDTWRDRALYDQARIYTKKGDKKKATEIYKDIIAKTPTTPLKDDISARLAALEG